MDPSSPEAQAILRYDNVTYDDINFYEFHHQIGKYLLLAGTTLMLWDHITTMPDEIKYVWQVKNRWTVATALFSFNRYISTLGFIVRLIQTLLQSHDRPMCGATHLTVYWNIASYACVEIILMLRVWVMYGRNRKLILFLVVVCAIALVTALVVPYKQPNAHIGVIPSFPTSLTLCVRASPRAYFWLLIIASSLDTIILSLFCVRVYLAWKDSMTTPILSALFTQGAVYYAVILCTFTFVIPATMHKGMYIPISDSSLIILISSIACNRLILSLRGLYYSQMVVGPTTLGTQTKGEYGDTVQVSMPSTFSSEVATSLGVSTLAENNEDDDRTCRGSGDSGTCSEYPAQARQDSTGLGRLPAGKSAAV